MMSGLILLMLVGGAQADSQEVSVNWTVAKSLEIPENWPIIGGLTGIDIHIEGKGTFEDGRTSFNVGGSVEIQLAGRQSEGTIEGNILLEEGPDGKVEIAGGKVSGSFGTVVPVFGASIELPYVFNAEVGIHIDLKVGAEIAFAKGLSPTSGYVFVEVTLTASGGGAINLILTQAEVRISGSIGGSLELGYSGGWYLQAALGGSISATIQIHDFSAGFTYNFGPARMGTRGDESGGEWVAAEPWKPTAREPSAIVGALWNHTGDDRRPQGMLYDHSTLVAWESERCGDVTPRVLVANINEPGPIPTIQISAEHELAYGPVLAETLGGHPAVCYSAAPFVGRPNNPDEVATILRNSGTINCRLYKNNEWVPPIRIDDRDTGAAMGMIDIAPGDTEDELRVVYVRAPDPLALSGGDIAVVSTSEMNQVQFLTRDVSVDAEPVILRVTPSHYLIVWSRDTDGNFQTSNDVDIFYSEGNVGSWTPPKPVLHNGVQDGQPQLTLYKGVPVLVFVGGIDTTLPAIMETHFHDGFWSAPRVVSVPGFPSHSPTVEGGENLHVAWVVEKVGSHNGLAWSKSPDLISWSNPEVVLSSYEMMGPQILGNSGTKTVFVARNTPREVPTEGDIVVRELVEGNIHPPSDVMNDRPQSEPISQSDPIFDSYDAALLAIAVAEAIIVTYLLVREFRRKRK